MRILHATDARGIEAATKIRAAMEDVEEGRLRRWVKWLSVPRGFHSEPEANREISLGIEEQFKAFGFEVQTQGPLRNIVALPRHPSPRLILVGAHYDSVPLTPGADDNASAVAAMLGCAEIIARVAPRAPVGFVAFNCEENGLLGSTDFVKHFLPTAGFTVAHAHVLEMVGYASSQPDSQRVPSGLPIRIPTTGDFLGLLANNTSGDALKSVLTHAKTYLPGFPVVGLTVALGVEKLFPVLARSDHAPFWQAGMASVMWTDTSEFRNPNYHLASDTSESLDYAFRCRVTQLLVATVLAEAAMFPPVE